MPQFAAVRRAVGGICEAADAATNPQAAETYLQRLDKLAAAVAAGAAAGTPDHLDPVGPLLARLEESGQAPGAVARIRAAVTRPNLFVEVDEGLLAKAVNRPVNEVSPINDVVLGTRVRGIGRTSGFVRLDFVPSLERAIVDIALDATNESDTKGSQGPVTVRTLGTTKVDARKRLIIDDKRITALPVEARTSTDTRTAGIGVNKKFGQRLIRRIASRKIAEMRPQAEAIAEGQGRGRRCGSSSRRRRPTAISRASRDYQAKFRRPLMERGWYPETAPPHHRAHSRLCVVARKSLADQIAAFTPPPAVDPDAVISARAPRVDGQQRRGDHARRPDDHAAVRRGAAEEEQHRHAAGTAERRRPEAVVDHVRQAAAGGTRRRRRPREDDRPWHRLHLRRPRVSARWTSGRPTAIEPGHRASGSSATATCRSIRPDFVPGGGKKLSGRRPRCGGSSRSDSTRSSRKWSTSSRCSFPGELAEAGPLPMEQLDARKDGWVAAGWRNSDPVIHESAPWEVIVGGEPTMAASAACRSSRRRSWRRDASLTALPVEWPRRRGSNGRTQIERNCTGLPWSWSEIGRASACGS